MASITIRKLDERVKQGLRVQAASNGLSMEEQARAILADAVMVERARSKQPQRTMADVLMEVHALVEEAGGFEIDAVKEPPLDYSIYDTMHSGKAA